MSNNNTYTLPTVPAVKLNHHYCLGCPNVNFGGGSLRDSKPETEEQRELTCIHEPACVRMEQRYVSVMRAELE